MRLTVAFTVSEMTVKAQVRRGKDSAENSLKSCSRSGATRPIDRNTFWSMFPQHDMTIHGGDWFAGYWANPAPYRGLVLSFFHSALA